MAPAQTIPATSGPSRLITAAEPATRYPRGLLPHRLVRWRRPLWWQEVAIIAIGYWLYSLGRNAIPEHESVALDHGRDLQRWQDALHLSWELSFNHFVAAHEWLAQVLNYYYATLHFIVTPVVLVWLFVRRASLYRGVRTAIVSTTLISLACFAAYPVAPPRLLPEFDYVDTIIRFHTWGSLADPAIAEQSNQFAAMPSLHMAWALWSGVVIWRCAPTGWVRALGVAHPVATLVVIVGTGNHFVLDAVGGVAVVALGFGVQRLLSGHGAFEPAPDAPDARPAPAHAPAQAP